MAKYCMECGSKLNDDALFCGNCGRKQPVSFTPPVTEPENNVATDDIPANDIRSDDTTINDTLTGFSAAAETQKIDAPEVGSFVNESPSGSVPVDETPVGGVTADGAQVSSGCGAVYQNEAEQPRQFAGNSSPTPEISGGADENVQSFNGDPGPYRQPPFAESGYQQNGQPPYGGYYQQQPFNGCASGGFAPAPAQNKKGSGLKIFLITFCTVVVLGIAAILLFVAPGFLKKKSRDPSSLTPSSTETIASSAQTEVTMISSSASANVSETETVTETQTTTSEAQTTTSAAQTATTASSAPTITASVRTPDFEKYAIPVNTDFENDFTYRTFVKGNKDKSVSARIVIDDYVVAPVSEEVMEFGTENGIDFTGYQIMAFYADAVFDSSDFDEGEEPDIELVFFDYYNVEFFDDTGMILADTEGDYFFRASAIVNGENRSLYIWPLADTNEDNGETVYSYTFMCLVPTGYDGVVVGFSNSEAQQQPGYITDNYSPFDYCLFRMK